MHDAAQPPLVDRRALALGAAVGAVVALVLAGTIASEGYDWIMRSDAQHFRRVAEDPFGPGTTFDDDPAAGASYRYGRILYPILSWATALGRPGLVRWTMPVVYVLSFAALFALACELCRGRGAPLERGLLLVAIPSMWFTIPLLVSEPLVTALILLVYRLDLVGRRRAVHAASAALLLAREAAALALVPLVIREVRARRWAAVGAWALTAVPLAAWWVWVRARVGTFPFLDPSPPRRDALDLPFRGAVRALGRAGVPTGWVAVAVAVGVVTAATAAWALRRARWAPVTEGAALLALLTVVFGSSVWVLPGEAVRLMFPAQALATLAIVSRGRADPAGYSV